MFQYIIEIVEFNSKSTALPDVGIVQSVFQIHAPNVYLV